MRIVVLLFFTLLPFIFFSCITPKKELPIKVRVDTSKKELEALKTKLLKQKEIEEIYAKTFLKPYSSMNFLNREFLKGGIEKKSKAEAILAFEIIKNAIDEPDLAVFESEYQIKLNEVILNNAYLSTLEALQAIDDISTQKNFVSLKKALVEKLSLNRFLSKYFIPEVVPLAPTQNETIVNNFNPVVDSTVMDTPEKVVLDELSQAKVLTEQAEYEKALDMINQIKQDNVLYNQAQIKKTEIMDLAVKELRKKAAKSFQSAIPVADKKAKSAYLEEAKQLLENAINKYPESSQIETIRQNLAVIQKNLQQLNDERTP